MLVTPGGWDPNIGVWTRRAERDVPSSAVRTVSIPYFGGMTPQTLVYKALASSFYHGGKQRSEAHHFWILCNPVGQRIGIACFKRTQASRAYVSIPYMSCLMPVPHSEVQQHERVHGVDEVVGGIWYAAATAARRFQGRPKFRPGRHGSKRGATRSRPDP